MLDIYKDTCLELQGLHSSTTPPQSTASQMTTELSQLLSDSLNKNFTSPQRRHVFQGCSIGLHYIVQGFPTFVQHTLIPWQSFNCCKMYALWMPYCNMSDRTIIIWHVLHNVRPSRYKPYANGVFMTDIFWLVAQSNKIWPLSTRHVER